MIVLLFVMLFVLTLWTGSAPLRALPVYLLTLVLALVWFQYHTTSHLPLSF